MLLLKKILWPTDFSEASYKTLEIVKELAARDSGEIWALHVVQPVSTFNAELTVSLPAFEQELVETTRASLEKVLSERGGSGLTIHPALKVGSPAAEIVQFADEEKMDMIVIATHGESAFHHFIFGSVAEKVIRLASCPVLVLRVPHHRS
jgi:nucleotide-binding universal stress UspA family protein